MPATYPDKLKVSAIRRYENGESIKALSQELHISEAYRHEYSSEADFRKSVDSYIYTTMFAPSDLGIQGTGKI